MQQTTIQSELERVAQLEDILVRKIDRIDMAYLSGQIKTEEEYSRRIAQAHAEVEAMSSSVNGGAA